MSAAELKQIQALNKVSNQVDVLVKTEIPSLIQRINNFSTLCCYIIWHKQYSHSEKYLRNMYKKLHMSCLGVDDSLTRYLISLDSIEAEGPIRLQRKQIIQNIQKQTKIIEHLIKRSKNIDQYVIPRIIKYCNQNANDILSSSSSTDSINTQINDNITKQQQTTTTKQSVIDRYKHMNLPHFQPKFNQIIDDNGNYILTTNDLYSVNDNDIQITHKGRIVLIEGVKLQQNNTSNVNNNNNIKQSNSMSSFFNAFNPFSKSDKNNNQQSQQQSSAQSYGIFQCRQVLPPSADLDAMTYKLAANGTLVIFIPRKNEKSTIEQNAINSKQQANTDSEQQQQSNIHNKHQQHNKVSPNKQQHNKHRPVAHHSAVSANKANYRQR